MKQAALKRRTPLRATVRTCAADGCEATFTPLNRQQRYCSWSCAGRANHPRLGEEKVCARAGCDVSFYRSPAQDQRYCSPACAYADRPKRPLEERRARSEQLRGTRLGTANPNFRHGKKVGAHLRGWNPAAKGESHCRSCGASGPLNLHHSVPRSICPPAAKRDLLNGLPLCAPCHTRWHRGTLVIPRSVFTAKEWAYISSLTLTGRDVNGWLDKHYPPPIEVAA